MKIVFKKDLPYEPELELKNYRREGLAELRRLLPHDYQLVSDYDLIEAWERFSDEGYCAGFLHVKDEYVWDFVEKTRVVKEAGK